MARALTREEAKQITRGRLLEAGGKLLRASGYGGLSVSAITREAGIAQPTFYVHFRDKDELVRVLARENLQALRGTLREARRQVREGKGFDAVRDTFRVALKAILDEPQLFALFTQEVLQPASPFGEQARELFTELRRDLADDLIGFGLPASTPKEQKHAEMMAEAMLAMTQALGLGHLAGRYGDLEEVVEVLARFAAAILSTASWTADAAESLPWPAPPK